MSNNSRYIYLLSSNARKKYILDALETLALPFRWVQHYRLSAEICRYRIETKNS